jgi:hypothetical protein
MGREIVRADFKALFDEFAPIAVQGFNQLGEHPPMLIFVKLGKEPGEIQNYDVLGRELTHMFFANAQGKRNLAHFLREMTTPGSPIRTMAHEFGLQLPDMVVQICEIWLGAEIRRKNETAEEFQKRADAQPLPSERPDRREAILLAFHTTNYSTMGLCHIVENPRRCELGELQAEGGKMIGPLSMTHDDE